MDLSEKPDLSDDSQLIRRIATAYSKAKEVQASISTGPYVIAGAWAQDIKTRRAEWLAAMKSGSTQQLEVLFKNFFRNSGVAGAWNYAYYDDARVNENSLRIKIYSDYLVWLDLVENGNTEELALPNIGNVWGLDLGGAMVAPGSPRLHYYSHRILRLIAGKPRAVLCEIGGGWGGFSYYLLNQIQQSPIYIGLDIPEVSMIAAYFLMKAFPKKKMLLFGEANIQDLDRHRIAQYDAVLLPNFCLGGFPAGMIDVGFNTGSMSEMDYPTIAEYIRQLDRCGMEWFFHDNSDRPFANNGAHIEVPASIYPIPSHYRQIYKNRSPFGEDSGRYREYLYHRTT